MKLKGWPSFLDTLVNGGVLNPGPLSPFRYRKSLAIVCNAVVGSLISGLLFMRCPLHIARLVSLLIVDPVERMAFRSQANVIVKRLKRILPFLTHCYSPSSVVFVGRVSRIAASAFSMTPRPILRTVQHAVLQARLFGVATATSGNSGDKLTGTCNLVLSAVAQTGPECITFPVFESFERYSDESSKSLSRVINDPATAFRLNVIDLAGKLVVSHAVSSSDEKVWSGPILKLATSFGPLTF